MARLGLLAVIVLAAAAPAHAVDRTKLPLGDGKISSTPTKGWAYSCQRANPGGGGAQQAGPWIDETDKTWDSTAKVDVQGSVGWDSVFSGKANGNAFVLAGNGLPSTATGTFPVAASDPAAQYDRNPNSIKAYSMSYSVPLHPARAASATCIGGEVGVSLLGAPFLSPFDAQLRDAPAREVEDGCDGHPHQGGVYHFHSLSACASQSNGRKHHSKLVGYALDGFGIYGYRGAKGKVLDDGDLDACHGHTGVVRFHGKRQRVYHYHATREFPYLVGCYRGTPVTTGP
jgi:hypothetical protein